MACTPSEALLIEPYFLDKLKEVELFGDPKDGLLESLKTRLPSGLTQEILTAAAENIIRTRGAGSFPPFPECDKAVRDAMQGKGAGALVVLQHAEQFEPITDENFSKRAIAFGRMQGLKDGKWPVAYRFRTEGDESFVWADADKWEAYFRYIKSNRANMIRAGHKVTVPSIDPGAFDVGFVYTGGEPPRRIAASCA